MCPLLIIVQGAPAAGKTTLAHRLQKDLSVGIVGADDVKEYFFDTLGHGSADWSRELGRTLKPYLYKIVEVQLKYGRSVIYESAFWSDLAKQDMADLLQKVDADVIELYCTVSEGTRRERFAKRIKDGERHVGHAGKVGDLPDASLYGRLGIGETVEIDTEHFSDQDYETLLKKLKQRLKEAHESTN